MFKVGDPVRLTKPSMAYALKTDVTVTVRQVVGQRIYVTTPADHRDRRPIENYTYPACEFELVTPEVPLFRKGDKVLVEYIVLEDETSQQQNPINRHVKIKAQGHRGESTTRTAEFLAAGSITRAPEPPYVPKPGDKFIFSGIRCLCIFADEKSVMYENRGNGHRYVCSPSLYTFKKDTN